MSIVDPIFAITLTVGILVFLGCEVVWLFQKRTAQPVDLLWSLIPAACLLYLGLI